MTGKEKSAQTLKQLQHLLRCPHCKQVMNVAGFQLVCTNNHSFDMAKQGYVNLLTHPVKTQYERNLFAARHEMITKSILYTELHNKIATIIEERFSHLATKQLAILDAGCGEGSHLQAIIEKCHNKAFVGVGLDLAKEGVRMAASNYKQSAWFVGDLAETPFKEKSFHVLFNILSPANYKEFKRLMAPESIMIKVVPRSNYLKELREYFYNDTAQEEYSNDNTVSLFKQHFQLIEQNQITTTKIVTSDELENLLRMTPLTWDLPEEDVASFIRKGPKEITVDLDILVGV